MEKFPMQRTIKVHVSAGSGHGSARYCLSIPIFIYDVCDEGDASGPCYTMQIVGEIEAELEEEGCCEYLVVRESYVNE